MPEPPPMWGGIWTLLAVLFVFLLVAQPISALWTAVPTDHSVPDARGTTVSTSLEDTQPTRVEKPRALAYTSTTRWVGISNSNRDIQITTGTSRAPIIEFGTVTTDQADASEWHTVTLSNSYNDPVVIMGPVSDVGSNPVHIRVRNVTSDNFQFQLEEWDYLAPGDHTTETMGYVVIEAGNYTIGNGTHLEAGTLQANQTFSNTSFGSEFDTRPAVLTTVQSHRNDSGVVTRLRNATAEAFEVRLQEEEANDGVHMNETIGYLAIEPGTTQLADILIEAGLTGDTVDDHRHRIEFRPAYQRSPVFLAGIQTFHGNNTASTRYGSLTSDSVDVFLDEETSDDSETGHLNEEVGHLSFSRPAIITETANLIVTNFTVSDSIRLVNETLRVNASLANRGLTSGSINVTLVADGRPVETRTVSVPALNTTVVRFEIEFGTAAVHNLTVQNLPATDVRILDHTRRAPNAEFGTLTTAQANASQWHTVGLNRTYVDPVVILGPPSFNGSQPVHTRIRNVTANSFQFQLEEWAFQNSEHLTETLSYIVIEAGRYTINNDTQLEAGTVRTDHNFTNTTFTRSFDRRPVVLTSVQTHRNDTAIVTRQRTTTNRTFEVRLQEAEAADGNHTNETIGYLAIEPGVALVDGIRLNASLTKERIDDSWRQLEFSPAYVRPPLFLARMQTFNGRDTAALRYRSLTNAGIEIHVDEPTGNDGESDHTQEVVGHVTIGESGTLGTPLVNGSLALNRSNVTVSQGASFWLNVTYDAETGNDSTAVFAVRFELRYNTTGLNATALRSGPFLGSKSETTVVTQSFDDSQGVITYNQTRVNSSVGVTGIGTVLQVKFNVSNTGPGQQVLEFRNVSIRDPNGSEVSTLVSNGTVSVSSAETLVVNQSDPAAYSAIQPAIENASEGDRVEVRPGQYREAIEITKNITLIAPDGAALNGSTLDRPSAGILISGNVAPVISGFAVTGYNYSVDAGGTNSKWIVRNTAIDGNHRQGYGIFALGSTGNWTVENVSIQNYSGFAVAASNSTGAWTVRFVRLANNTVGVSAYDTTGPWTVANASIVGNDWGVIAAEASRGLNQTAAWTVVNSSIRNTGNTAVYAAKSQGDWTIKNAIISNSSAEGVYADFASGDWTIANTIIESSEKEAVDSDPSSGNWTIERTIIRDNAGDGVNVNRSRGRWRIQSSLIANNTGHGVDAPNSMGRWSIHASVIAGNEAPGLNASNVSPRGNATHNYWDSSDGPSGDFNGSGDAVIGNVTVSPFYADRNLTNLTLVCSPLASDLPAPSDPDGDGDFEDTNGNDRFDFDDIVTLFEELSNATPSCEDFNHNGRIDFDDIVTLFEEI